MGQFVLNHITHLKIFISNCFKLQFVSLFYYIVFQIENQLVSDWFEYLSCFMKVTDHNSVWNIPDIFYDVKGLPGVDEQLTSPRSPEKKCSVHLKKLRLQKSNRWLIWIVRQPQAVNNSLLFAPWYEADGKPLSLLHLRCSINEHLPYNQLIHP